MNLYNFGFSFDELEFEGLRFRKSNRYTSAYFDKLLEDGTHYSKVKFLDGYNDQCIESIHIKLSWQYLFVAASMITLSVCIIFFFQKYYGTSSVLFILAVSMHLISRLFLRSARKEKVSMAMGEDMVNMVFDDLISGNEKGKKDSL
ncbi:MAG: hypothetical protein IH591_01980 [Bacteroidales bacterium]|nr:hypothetical protein [Bacteroidales bacterium]